MVYRVCVEKKPGLAPECASLLSDCRSFLNLTGLTNVRIWNRYDAEGMLWSTLMGETARMNLVADDPCLCCAVFHDGEYKEEDVDVEVQKTVKGHYEDTEHVRFKTLPAVQVASVVHKGSYSTLGAAQAALAAWVRDNGYAYAAPSFSIYHVSPHETRDPDAFVTELCTPVVKK